MSDRIAQGVVKDYLEPILEPLFHTSSFGYRPGRSAHDALAQCQHNCIQYPWVVDLDIKGFFDSISHEWMRKMVSHHTQEKWVLLYTERWLKACTGQPDDSTRAVREKGTPQGGVVSPLLSNLYLHHAFDRWMAKCVPANPFERYADDIIVHCNSREEAERLLASIRERLSVFALALHPEKTKLVYCKNYLRKEKYKQNSFTFLSYRFQPRSKPNTFGRPDRFMVFGAAICSKAKAFIREKIRAVFNPGNAQVSLERTAVKLNPKIRGWLNYYSRFGGKVAGNVFLYLNGLTRRWVEEKYRLTSRKAVMAKYRQVLQSGAGLFVHWRIGIIK